MAPIYNFTDEQGNVLERFFWMRDVPENGETITDPEDVRSKITRIPSAGTRPVVQEYRHVAHSLPRIHDPRAVVRLREAEARAATNEIDRQNALMSADEWRHAKPVWKNTTSEGKPVFTSKAQIQEFQARTGHRLGWSQD